MVLHQDYVSSQVEGRYSQWLPWTAGRLDLNKVFGRESAVKSSSPGPHGSLPLSCHLLYQGSYRDCTRGHTQTTSPCEVTHRRLIRQPTLHGLRASGTLRRRMPFSTYLTLRRPAAKVHQLSNRQPERCCTRASDESFKEVTTRSSTNSQKRD
jgi:hypothetical protein